MPFANAVMEDYNDLPAGEVIKASPHNVSAFDTFEDGLVEGRFVKYDAGSIDNLDGSATPTIAGIARRKITGEIGSVAYSTTGLGIDQVAEVINFGFATVTVTDGADPTRFAPVYVVNATGDDAGKATQVATGNLAVDDVVFWEPKAAGVWLVRMNKFL